MPRLRETHGFRGRRCCTEQRVRESLCRLWWALALVTQQAAPLVAQQPPPLLLRPLLHAPEP